MTHELSLAPYRLAELRILVEESTFLRLSSEVADAIGAGADFVRRKAGEDRYIYGVNTGFGSLCETRIRPDEARQLQHNHLVSHACGVGEPVSETVVRWMILLKLLTFRSGHTGITVRTAERLLELWNRAILPVVPRKGTVGASGDLAPLAHLALPLIGLGRVRYDGRELDGPGILSELGWEPLELEPKEGLALTNGVQYINSVGADCVLRARDLVRAADAVAALSIQAFSCSRTFYQPAYHETSYHPERRTVAANLRRLLDESNHHELPACNRSMQDPYSYRCIPQVHGAVRQVLDFAYETIEREVNGVSDNPLFFPETDEILFGGNLHGESTALSVDSLAMAMSELANISERRTYLLLSGQRGLPSFLVKRPGLNSGYMIVQYTSAALLNENKVLASPASVDTIPTCQLQEDHVSMGGTSVHKLQTILENCEHILAIELLIAAQAIDFVEKLKLSGATASIYRGVRERVPFLEEDSVMSGLMEEAHRYFLENHRAWVDSLGLE